MFQIFGAIAEFERNLIRERTQAGLAAARTWGRMGGRPPKLSEKKRQMLVEMYEKRDRPIKEICELFGISKKTLYQYLKER